MLEFQYIAFHKPFGVLSQFTSEEGVPNLSAFGLPKGVYAAGRLDKDSEGLLLLTDDGPFVNRLLKRHSRVYWAQVEGEPSEAALAQLRRGVTISSGLTQPCIAQRIDAPNVVDRVPGIRKRLHIPTAWIKLCLKEGKNRQVRKMTAAVGYPTLRLIRCRIGQLELTQLGVAAGEWKPVQKEDVLGAYGV